MARSLMTSRPTSKPVQHSPFYCCQFDKGSKGSGYKTRRRRATNLEEDLGHAIEQQFGEEHCSVHAKKCEVTRDSTGEDINHVHQHCYITTRSMEHNHTHYKFEVVKSGCWVPDMKENPCMRETIMLQAQGTQGHHFGCCNKTLCNYNFTAPSKAEIDRAAEYDDQRTFATIAQQPNGLQTVVFVLVALVAFVVVAVVSFLLYRKIKQRTKRRQRYTEEPQPLLARPLAPEQLIIGDLSLAELERQTIIARGRFGSVWKAQLACTHVAIKVFPLQDKQSWLTEQDMYTLPHMQHENILRFLGVRRSPGDDGGRCGEELWLVTEYQPLGSLFDHLKANVLSWHHTLKICESMLAGLSHLHEFIPAHNGTRCKPTIAHRDFKSRNVLLKQDLTACIADFGLALKFEPGTSVGDTLTQVGTRRYMAPEVLDGAISFRLDSFLRIDMYAASLVLWEVISRCSAIEGPIDPYRLPLEEEVGSHPTLDRMQEVVVVMKKRPLVKPHWRKHPGISSICQAMSDCWDADADARLSASCVLQRIRSLKTDQLVQPEEVWHERCEDVESTCSDQLLVTHTENTAPESVDSALDVSVSTQLNSPLAATLSVTNTDPVAAATLSVTGSEY